MASDRFQQESPHPASYKAIFKLLEALFVVTGIHRWLSGTAAGCFQLFPPLSPRVTEHKEGGVPYYLLSGICSCQRIRLLRQS